MSCYLLQHFLALQVACFLRRGIQSWLHSVFQLWSSLGLEYITRNLLCFKNHIRILWFHENVTNSNVYRVNRKITNDAICINKEKYNSKWGGREDGWFPRLSSLWFSILREAFSLSLEWNKERTYVEDGYFFRSKLQGSM